ncbi:MAG: phosphate acyltransferase PlsX [Coriobacteriia bacterium]|nr:phosphate acyltransferase PlsX [Coriobacteriia bacterium]
MSQSTATVAVDAMGGDAAPGVVLSGVAEALAADPTLRVLLVGPEAIVTPLASDRLEPVVATEIIAMDEHPASAVRTKKDSSIVVGCRLVREGRADAFFSAGSTGACMAAATLVMGRIPGVSRPAIATVIPGAAGPTVLLDVGANADVKADMLVQFAHMGSAYARIILGIEAPRVGLLNIGEEPTKGSLLAQEAYALMAAEVPGFVGNVEGRSVPSGDVDVIVTDGFTGNVTLKVLEGLSAMLLGQVKAALTETTINRLAAGIVSPSLRAIKDRLDPDAYGGAPLLGVNGVCIIGHGSAGPRAIANGIAVGARAVRGGLTGAIAEGLSR